MPYAILNRRNKKFVCGTDFNYYPRRQILSEEIAKVYETYEDAKFAMKYRECGRNYKIVPVKLVIQEGGQNDG